MDMSFAALYLLSVLSLFGLAILTGYLFEHGRSAWRRWRCKQEMKQAHRELIAGINASGKRLADTIVALEQEASSVMRRRQQLDALATARDKAERKIH